ncbi:plasmid mobilization protein [Prevotella sp. 885]|uniref:plasmid mobilization protein n=1 Tax=Prevotella sp. 885 TaxID=2022527 RepID=UPI0020CE7463|nr:hypothetical protein [Prevotella sp. 885]
MAKHVINNPGGRKPLPEEEKYGKPIPVRFTQKQFVRIKRKAGEMPISTYIREGALHAIIRQPVSKELMKEIRDLNNLGTNINTLVKFGPLEKVCGYRSTIKTLYCPFIKSKNG